MVDQLQPMALSFAMASQMPMMSLPPLPMPVAVAGGDASTLVSTLAVLDEGNFMGVLKAVLAMRGDFVRPITQLLVPNIIYPPADILTERRCVGTVKNFFAEKKFGFISCTTMSEEFGKDCIVLQSQLRGIPVGTPVNFGVCLGKDDKPQAFDVREVKSVCMFHARGFCKDGANCLFSHNSQDADSVMPMQCPWFSKGFCNKGNMCPHIHDINQVPQNHIQRKSTVQDPLAALTAMLPPGTANGQKRSHSEGPGAGLGPDIKEALGTFIGQIKSIDGGQDGAGSIMSPGLQALGHTADVPLAANIAKYRKAGEVVQFSALLTNANKLQAHDVKAVTSEASEAPIYQLSL